MNKRVNFLQQDGLGLTQDTLDFMQSSYRDAIGAIASAFGNYIILSGVVESGANLTDGWVIIDGELMPFVGGLKEANVTSGDVVGFEQFSDLSTKGVYYTRTARPAITGGYPYAQFRRIDTVINILTNLTDLITAFTNHTHNYSSLANLPVIPEQKILRAASVLIGDVDTVDKIVTISFTDIGTGNYVVSGSLVSLSSNYNVDNDVVWMVREKTNTDFKLCLRDLALVVQNLRFDYAIIKM